MNFFLTRNITGVGGLGVRELGGASGGDQNGEDEDLNASM